MTDQTYTLLQLVEKRRADLMEEVDESELHPTSIAFVGVLHDFICASPDGSPAFTVIRTADGEPFIDWQVHTEAEWYRLAEVADMQRGLANLMRKMFGR